MYFIIAVLIIALVFVFINFFNNKNKKTKIEKQSSNNTKTSSSTSRRTNPSVQRQNNIFNEGNLNLYIQPKKPEDLTKYYIPPSFNMIDSEALSQCTNLKDIYIHDDVTLVEDKSFLYCVNLTNVNVDEDNKKYCSKLGSFFSKNSKQFIYYPPCKQTSTYFIPQGVETISSFAFANSKFLKYVIIPNTVTSISENSFVNCKSLKQIVIPQTVTDIHPRAFNICPKLSIRGYKDSMAEEFCKKLYIPFEYLTEQ